MSKVLKFLLALILLGVEANTAFARPIGRRFTAQISGGGAASSGALVPYWFDGLSVGNFDNSTDWQELSGIASANLAGNENYLWIISDAPANMLAAILKSNASNQGVWTLQTPPTYVDWEDIDSATVAGVSYLYIFDFGNNGSGADSRGTGIDMRIFRAIEPTITGSNSQITSGNYIQIDAAFPAGNPPVSRDTETAFVEWDTGKIWIIIKRDASQLVYSLPHAASYSGTQTLTYEGIMTAIPSSTTQPLGATLTYAVDGAMNPAGTEILIKNYDKLYYFPRNKATQTVMQALQQSLVEVPSYVGGGHDSPYKSHPNAEPQGEGITYTKDGRDLYSNSEYLSGEGSTAARYPLFKYTRATKVPTTTIFQDGLTVAGATYAGTSSTTIWDTNPNTNYGNDATNVLDKAIGVETDQRKTLLKFDLSAIPTTATVIGCKLESWIAAEGQGWTWYRMLVTWDESSTYNSLTGGVNDDGVEASTTESSRNGVNLDTILNVTVRDNLLVSDCQAMVSNPSTNYGWLGESTDITGGDGVQFDSEESVTAGRRPKLTIRWYN